MSIFSIRNLAFVAFLGTAGMASAQTDYVRTYFTEREVLVQEGGTTGVVVELSRTSTLDIVVPIVISEASTAIPASSLSEGDGDYYINDTDSDGVVWDAETGTGTLTFSASQRRLTINVRVLTDSIEEDDKTIIFEMDTANVTVARPVTPTTHTLIIQDDDPVGIFFKNTEYSVAEGLVFEVELAFSNPPAGEVALRYNLAAGTATEDDLDDEFEGFPAGTVTIAAGSSEETIEISTGQDLDAEELEQLTLTLERATVAGDGGGDLRVDSRPVILSIVDNDPTEAVIDIAANEPEEREFAEYGSITIDVLLDARVASDVTIPVNFGGDATRGDISENNDADYEAIFPDADVGDAVVIPEGAISARFTIRINSDAREEGDESATISLGTPVVEGGGGIGLGELSSTSITILDNDPVTLYFAKENAHYDADDESTGEPFIPSSGFIVGEPDGAIRIPLFLSSPHGDNTVFDIEVVADGTTATLADPRSALADQEWDFYVQAPSGIRPEQLKVSVGIGATRPGIFVNIILNDDQESRPVFGQSETPDDVEGDETVRLRISAVEAESGVSLGETSEFTLTIREFPEIDVTALFAEGNFRDGEAVLNPTTNLHELEFNFTPADVSALSELAGYRSYKIAFRPARFDPANPDSEANDPLVNTSGSTYYRIVDPPFRPRYPTGTTEETIIEGEPLGGDDTFSDENADVRVQEYYFLRQLNLDVLDPVRTEERVDFADPGDPFHYVVEFSNSGFREFDESRITQEGGLRVYLSRADMPAVGQGTILPESNILRFLPREDGSIFIEVNNPNANPISVEYLDEQGAWHRAQPPVLRTLGTRLFWIDHGPPRTKTHPSEVDFRIYRFSTVN